MIVTLILAAISLSSSEAQGQNRRGKRIHGVRSPRTNVERPQPPSPVRSRANGAATTTASGLTYLITHHGQGSQPTAGEVVVVHYTGALTNGVKFDSSRDRDEPIAFKLGAGQVIKGWDEGVAQLHVGDQAILVIPPQLGYGARGAGDVIPPDATLIFIVELVDVKETSLSEVLSQTQKERGMEAAIKQYRELKSKGMENIYTSESDINGWGYRLLRDRQVREAIEVFKLNAEAYPRSANVYDSLAEAYLAGGDKQAAIENYSKALAIDPQLESARRALQALKPN
jgi:peptidylprolyl isomerase